MRFFVINDYMESVDGGVFGWESSGHVIYVIRNRLHRAYAIQVYMLDGMVTKVLEPEFMTKDITVARIVALDIINSLKTIPNEESADKIKSILDDVISRYGQVSEKSRQMYSGDPFEISTV